MSNQIGIFGTSGFAREIADICVALGYVDIVFLDKPEQTVSAKNTMNRIVDSETNLKKYTAEEYDFAIGIADPARRKAVAQNYRNLSFPNLVHPTVTFGIGSAEQLQNSRGVIVAAGARFMSAISVGDFSIFSLNCTVGHDCLIGEYASIMPGANLSGNVYLGNQVYVGTNATVLNGQEAEPIRLGQGAVVGAGAVVTRNVENAITVVGNPARQLITELHQ